MNARCRATKASRCDLAAPFGSVCGVVQACSKRLKLLAEGVGFEPTEPLGSLVFKTRAIDHSATLPSSVFKTGAFFRSATPPTWAE